MRRRNVLLFAVVASILIAPGTALADKKKANTNNDTPKESVSMPYGSTKWTYTEQKSDAVHHPHPVTHTGSATVSGAGGSNAKTTHKDIAITKKTDKSSPQLNQATTTPTPTNNNLTAAPRDSSTGQATGRRQYKPVR